jgi:hypothetical protein
MVSGQQSLWHDSLEDALRSVVEGLGGPKRVAGDLWPAKPVADAARLLNHCLSSDRPEKLALEEIVFILRAGSRAGVHVAMAFLAETCGYEQPRPVSPGDQVATLQREYIKAAQEMAMLARRIERIGGDGNG